MMKQTPTSDIYIYILCIKYIHIYIIVQNTVVYSFSILHMKKREYRWVKIGGQNWDIAVGVVIVLLYHVYKLTYTIYILYKMIFLFSILVRVRICSTFGLTYSWCLFRKRITKTILSSFSQQIYILSHPLPQYLYINHCIVRLNIHMY